MITEEQLVEEGYKRYSHHNRQHTFSDFLYQKKFVDATDGKSIKYWINIHHYPALTISGQTDTWMVELSNNKPHFTFQIHRPDDLKKVEDLCEKFFSTMGCEYYERHQPTP